jgi:hypothetical protein
VRVRQLAFSYGCLGLFSRQDAKNAKFGFIFPFAAFAPLREIFRVLVAVGRARLLEGSKCFSNDAIIVTSMTIQQLHTYCAMCISRCGVVATVEDGRLTKVNADPALLDANSSVLLYNSIL